MKYLILLLLTGFKSIISFCRPAQCRGVLVPFIRFVQSLEIENRIWSLPRDIRLAFGMQPKEIKADRKLKNL